MADLTGNTEYGSTGATPSPRKTYPKLYVNAGGAMRSPGAPAANPAGAPAVNFTMPTNVALGEPNETKITPVGTDYSSFKQAPTFPYEFNAGLVNPQQPMIHQIPGENRGQYVFDQTTPGAMVKSNREFVNPAIKKKMLGGLPSSLFQVDHIIPLWANGADTPNNLQILPIEQHERKTKAQAVALTLLAHKKIDFNEARVLAQTWENRDLTGIPNLSDDGNGLLDVGVAEEAYNRWKKYDREGVPVTWKSFKESIPDAAQDFGKGWIPEFAREFVKGVASGLTAGIVPYIADDDANAIEKGSGFVGNIVGSVIGIGKFAKLAMPIFAKTGWKAFNPQAVKLVDLATSAAPIAAAAKTAAPVTKFSKILAKSKAPYDMAVKTLQKNAADNIIRNTAIFSTYGALSTAGQLTLQSQDEDTVQALTERFVSDVGLGIITGGLKNNWAGSAAVGVGTLMLGTMLGEEPEGNLLNAATMAALHRFGTITPRKLDSAALSKAVDKEVPEVAQTVLAHWGGNLPAPKAPVGANTTAALTQEEIFDATHRALQNLDNYALAGRNGTNFEFKNSLSLEDYNQYRSQILASSRELYKRTLPPAEREAADLADLISLSQSMKEKTFLKNGGLTLPDSAVTFVQKLDTSLLDSKGTPRNNIDFSDVSGSMPLRGMGATELNEQIGRAYIAAKAKGQTFDEIILVDRADTEPIWRRMSDSFSPKEIADGTRKPFQKPQNSLQAYALLRNPQTGEVQIGNELGWWPRRHSIEEAPQSLNKHPLIASGKMPRNNPELNKDPIVERMRAEGMPAIIARVSKADVGSGTATTKASNKPYIIAELDNRTWNLSKDLWGDATAEGVDTTGDSIAAAIRRAKNATEVTDIQRNVSAITKKAESAGMDAGTVLQQARVTDPAGTQTSVSEFIKGVGRAVETSQSPEQLALNLKPFGINLEGNLAGDAFARKNQLTARQVLGLMKVSVDNKTADPAAAAYFEGVVTPFLRTANKGSVDKAWSEVPVAPARPLESVGKPTEMTPNTAITQPLPLEAPKSPVAKSSVPSDTSVATEAPASPISASVDQGATNLATRVAQRVAKGDIETKARPVPTGKSILEQPLIEVPKTAQAAPTGQYAEVAEELRRVGMDTGRNFDTLPLDLYVEELIRFIKNAPVDDAAKKLLARDAMKLLTKEELDMRQVSMGKSDEAWQKGTRGMDDIGKYVNAQRDRLASEFDIETALPDRTFMTKEADKDRITRVTDMVKEDVQPFFEGITQNRTAPATESKRGYAEAFDEAATQIWGPGWKGNYGLMKLLTDKTKFGRKLWHEGEELPTGERLPGLFSETANNGRPISQPKEVVASAAEGNRGAMSQAMARRNKEIEEARLRRGTSEDEGGVIKAERAGEEVDTATGGFRVEDPTQSAKDNIQDLDVFSSRNFMGMLDEIERGSDPLLNASRGVEDAQSQILWLVKEYNKAVGKGEIKGDRVSLKSKDIFTKIKEHLKKEAEKAQVLDSNRARLLQEIEELDKANVAMRELTVSPKNRAKIDEEIRSNEERINEIKKELGETPADGQGGPGFSVAAPAVSPFAMMPKLTALAGVTQQPGAPEASTFAAPPALMKAQQAGTLLGQPTQGPAGPSLDTSINLKRPNFAPALSAMSTTQQILDRPVPIKQPPVAAAKPSLFRRMSDAVATGVDKVVGNKPTVVYGGGHKSEPSAIILGIDTTRYATDPGHASKLTKIVSNMPALQTAEQINAYIKAKAPTSPVTGQMVAAAASRHGVPAQLVLAIMQQDSSLGTAGLGAKTKNPGNVGNDDDGNIRRYQTWGDGVNAVAEWLARHRVSSNLASR